MASPRKGMYWPDAEVEHMLKYLCNHNKGGWVMESTHMETLNIFHRVSESLASAGFACSIDQAHAKFKQEKYNGSSQEKDLPNMNC